jgi:cold shock CspA family protein
MLGTITKLQVKKNKPNRSYGFIEGHDGETYWFALRGREDLEIGMDVSFKGEKNEKGLTAVQVQKVS